MATVDMRKNEMLHLAEMLNAECGAYKRKMAENISASYKVGIYCHDCACNVKSCEGKYCRRILLDAWHANGHSSLRSRTIVELALDKRSQHRGGGTDVEPDESPCKYSKPNESQYGSTLPQKVLCVVEST